MYGIGGSNLAIGISLIMRDRFTTQAATAGQAMTTLQQRALSLQRQQMSMQRSMNATGAAIGAAAIVGLGQWYREGAKFGYTMKYVSSLAGGEYDKLSSKALKLGEDTIFTARAVSDGMRWMAQAGMKSNDIHNSIGSIANLATATLTDIGGRGGAADWVTNIAKAWNIPLDNEDSITRTADTIAASVNKANITLYDYGESMKYAQSTAKTLGVTLEETSAAIMVMGNAGMQGSIAGVAIENSLRYFARAIGNGATKRQKNALSTMGLSPEEFKDAQGNLISYGEILRKVGEASRGLQGNVAVQGAMVDIFGVRGGRNASLLIDKLGDYQSLLQDIQNSEGYSKKVSDEMMDTSEGAILQLISTWESFKIKFSESIAPMITPLLKGLRHVLVFLNNMISTNTGAKLAMIGTAFLVIRTAVMGYRAIVLSLRLAHGMIGTTAAAGTTQAVSGYNAATAAANRYAAAAGRAGMGGMVGGLMGGASSGGPIGRAMTGAGMWLGNRGIGRSTVGTNAHGVPYNRATGRFVPRGTPSGWSMGGAGGAVGRFGRMAGRMSLPAMLAGMGLEYGSQAVGADTTAGKTMGVAGDTIGWAGTGAMLGSIIPGVGTAVGAVVGGIGGLLYSLSTRLGETADEVEAQKDKLESSFDQKQWLAEVNRLNKVDPQTENLKFGPGQFDNSTGAYENSSSRLMRAMAAMNTGRGGGDIIINIDGEKKFRSEINELQYKKLYNLAI